VAVEGHGLGSPELQAACFAFLAASAQASAQASAEASALASGSHPAFLAILPQLLLWSV
jgi:hypothetical protein